MVIDDLRKARNHVVHLGKKAKPEFEIIRRCFKAVVDSFSFIEKEMCRKLFPNDYLNFI